MSTAMSSFWELRRASSSPVSACSYEHVEPVPTAEFEAVPESPPTSVRALYRGISEAAQEKSREPSPYPLFENSGPSRSKEFWFDDGSVVIKVDNTLYNVYKGVLIKHSECIRLKFFPPSRTITLKGKNMKKKGVGKIIEKVVEGVPNLQLGTLNEPLVLDVEKSDFETFLSYIFPQDFAAQYEFALKEWSATLSIAKKLGITSICAVAINNIQKMSSPIDLIELGRKYAISQLYNEGFRHLCHREESLSLQEGEKIGLASVIQIAHARDLLAKGSLWSDLEFSTEFTLVD